MFIQLKKPYFGKQPGERVDVEETITKTLEQFANTQTISRKNGVPPSSATPAKAIPFARGVRVDVLAEEIVCGASAAALVVLARQGGQEAGFLRCQFHGLAPCMPGCASAG